MTSDPSDASDPAPPDAPATSRTRIAAEALAVVLDLEADELRADSPLADLGADAIARIQWADVVEQLSRDPLAVGQGGSLRVDDVVLGTASTLGDLAAGLRTADAR
jgi:hypothetical protein